MTTAAIDNELVQEAARLSEAKRQATEAAKQLAKDPSNLQLRIAVAEAQQAVAEVQVGIDVLTAARVEGEKAASMEAGEAYRAETLEMFNQAKALIEKRVAAGKDIDTALSALRDVLVAWKTLNTEAALAANDFHRRIYNGRHSTMLGMESDILNALADQISEVVVGISNANHYFGAFNQHLRRTAGVPESAEKDAKQSCARYLELLEVGARAKGVI